MAEKKTTVYTPTGKPLEVNSYMAELIKNGDKSLKGFTLAKPKAK